MKIIEVNPYDYRTSEMDAEGYWHEEDTLPVDEWNCTGCEAPLGWQLHETDYSSNLLWTQTWMQVGGHPNEIETPIFCEDCKQNHEEVEE